VQAQHERFAISKKSNSDAHPVSLPVESTAARVTHRARRESNAFTSPPRVARTVDSLVHRRHRPPTPRLELAREIPRVPPPRDS